jgi:hypothetical protein
MYGLARQVFVSVSSSGVALERLLLVGSASIFSRWARGWIWRAEQSGHWLLKSYLHFVDLIVVSILCGFIWCPYFRIKLHVGEL